MQAEAFLQSLDRMQPSEIGARMADLRAEAEALLAANQAEYDAATARLNAMGADRAASEGIADAETRRRLFPLIRSLKAEIRRRLQDA